MKTEQIIILIVSFFLGMLVLNLVKNVCGCELKEGFGTYYSGTTDARGQEIDSSDIEQRGIDFAGAGNAGEDCGNIIAQECNMGGESFYCGENFACTNGARNNWAKGIPDDCADPYYGSLSSWADWKGLVCPSTTPAPAPAAQPPPPPAPAECAVHHEGPCMAEDEEEQCSQPGTDGQIGMSYIRYKTNVVSIGSGKPCPGAGGDDASLRDVGGIGLPVLEVGCKMPDCKGDQIHAVAPVPPCSGSWHLGDCEASCGGDGTPWPVPKRPREWKYDEGAENQPPNCSKDAGAAPATTMVDCDPEPTACPAAPAINCAFVQADVNCPSQAYKDFKGQSTEMTCRPGPTDVAGKYSPTCAPADFLSSCCAPVVDCEGSWVYPTPKCTHFPGGGVCSPDGSAGTKTKTFTVTRPATPGGESCQDKYNGAESGDTVSTGCKLAACPPRPTTALPPPPPPPALLPAPPPTTVAPAPAPSEEHDCAAPGNDCVACITTGASDVYGGFWKASGNCETPQSIQCDEPQLTSFRHPGVQQYEWQTDTDGPNDGSSCDVTAFTLYKTVPCDDGRRCLQADDATLKIKVILGAEPAELSQAPDAITARYYMYPKTFDITILDDAADSAAPLFSRTINLTKGADGEFQDAAWTTSGASGRLLDVTPTAWNVTSNQDALQPHDFRIQIANRTPREFTYIGGDPNSVLARTWSNRHLPATRGYNYTLQPPSGQASPGPVTLVEGGNGRRPGYTYTSAPPRRAGSVKSNISPKYTLGISEDAVFTLTIPAIYGDTRPGQVDRR